MTGWGWVGSGGSGTEVRVEGAGLGGMDVEFSLSEAGEGDGAEDGGYLSGLAVDFGWFVCRVVSKQIATLESKVEK